jgi:hypothetical protein
MNSHSTAEQKRVWKQKKLSEDPEYFQKARQAYRQRKLTEDPDFFKKRFLKFKERYPTYSRDRYEKNKLNPNWKERQREYRKHYISKNPGCMTEIKLRQIHREPERHRAIEIANRLVTLKKNCEQCGSTENLEGHHQDYSKPLQVNTFCKICHEALHAKLREAGKQPAKLSVEDLKNRKCSTCSKIWPSCGRTSPALRMKKNRCSLWEA